MSNLGDVLHQVVCIPSYIPEDWSYLKLTDVCTPKQWRTISSGEMTTAGYPVFGANGFVGFYHEYNHEDETVAITCRGNTCGTINRIPPKTYITGNSMALDNIKSRVVSQDYLYYSLKYRGVGDSISGSAQPQITGAGLRTIEFPAPPLSEQQKIAAILSSVDNVIEKTRAQIDKLKDLKTGMMQELLTQGIGHTEFKDSPVGRIPASWEVLFGGTFLKLGSGSSPSQVTFDSKGDTLFMKVDDFNYPVNGTHIKESKLKFFSVQNPKITVHPEGSIVIAKRGAAISKNRVRLLFKNTAVDTNLMTIRVKRGSCPRFVRYFLEFFNLNNVADTTSIPQINNFHLNELLIPVPPLKEQVYISDSLDAIHREIELRRERINSIDFLKKALMQDLLTGRVKVKVDQKESAVA